MATGALIDRAKVLAGVAQLRGWGLEPVLGKNLFAKDFIFAGTVAQRAADMVAALEDERVAAIWAARGGYGAYAVAQALAGSGALKRARRGAASGPLLVGHSDVTALHLLWARLRWPSLHASCLDRLGDAKAARQERAALRASLFGKPFPSVTRGLRSLGARKTARGPLVGGNLALLAASIGTRWQLDARGMILFIEEVGERAYRLDRMLTQLRAGGTLDGLRAVVLGDFTDCGEPDGRRLWPEVLRRHFARAPYPVLAGLRAGHGAVRLPLPFGRAAQARGGARPSLAWD